MAKAKLTGFEALIAVKLPLSLRERLDAEVAKERAALPMMAPSLSDVVRTLLMEALNARNRNGPPPSA